VVHSARPADRGANVPRCGATHRSPCPPGDRAADL
jgi:hypothetical protein